MSIYCTYVTFYSGNKLPPFYIGSTSVKKINSGYHGSVASQLYKTIWQHELLINPHLFKTKILSLHDTRKAALMKELYFQQKLNVVRSTMYINMAYSNGTYVHIKHTKETIEKIKQSLTGRKQPHKEETKIKIGLKNKGKIRSDEYKKKMSETKRGCKGTTNGITLSEETRQKISKALTGRKNKPHSEETRKKIGDANRGKKLPPLTDEQKELRRINLLGKPQKKQTCPHCGKIGGNGMKRYHFDNCKFRLLISCNSK